MLIRSVLDAEIEDSVRCQVIELQLLMIFRHSFFKHFYLIIYEDVCPAMKQFLLHTSCLLHGNITLLLLFLRGLMHQFHLITMQYPFINPKHGVFIRDRSISADFLIVQKAIYNLQKAPIRHSYIAIKLDMEQEYDKVR